MIAVNRVRRVLCCCAAILPVVLLGGCAGGKTSGPPVRLGYIEFAADLPFFVALEKGYFRECGVDVQPVKFRDSSEALNAVLAGKIDGAMGNSLSALYAIELKSPAALRLIYPFSETKSRFVSHLLVPRNSAIRDVSQLRGKTVGTYSGATQLLYLRLFLDRIGLRPGKDVMILQVAPGLQTQALQGGQFDALFTLEPYSTIALHKGGARDLLAFPRRLIMDPFPSGASSLSSQFVTQRTAEARHVVMALGRAVRSIQQDPSSAKLSLGVYTPLGKELAPKAEIYEWASGGKYDMKAIQAEADLFTKYELLSGRVSTAGMFLTPQELDAKSWLELR